MEDDEGVTSNLPMTPAEWSRPFPNNGNGDKSNHKTNLTSINANEKPLIPRYDNKTVNQVAITSFSKSVNRATPANVTPLPEKISNRDNLYMKPYDDHVQQDSTGSK